MKSRIQLVFLTLSLLGIFLAGNTAAEIWVWDFPIDESQVKNGPEPDGSTNSPATGQGHLEYDSRSNEFKIRIEFEGLAGDLSKLHVHGPSKSDRSTPRHVIEFLGPPEVPASLATTHGTYETTMPLSPTVQEGFITLSPERVLELLMDGHTYLNVHTTVFGMGEIRGNLGKPTVRQAHLKPQLPKRPNKTR